MADSSVVITAGSGTNLHSSTRSYSGTTKHDQYTLPAEYDQASYIIAPTTSVSLGTANDHVLQVMAGSSLNVRVRCIHVEVAASAGTAAITVLELWRLSSAGTGGTSYTARPLDSADSAAGMTAMALPTAKGTETVCVGRKVLTVRQTVSTLGGAEDVVEWAFYGMGMKSLLIPAGTSNGVAIKLGAAVATSSVAVEVYAVETSFV